MDPIRILTIVTIAMFAVLAVCLIAQRAGAGRRRPAGPAARG